MVEREIEFRPGNDVHVPDLGDFGAAVPVQDDGLVDVADLLRECSGHAQNKDQESGYQFLH